VRPAVEEIVAGAPVAQVAARSGYRSVSAFSAAFRGAMGVSPTALREGGPPAGQPQGSSHPR